MRGTAGKTHTLYPEACWHKHVNADCYHCGIGERAYRLARLGDIVVIDLGPQI